MRTLVCGGVTTVLVFDLLTMGAAGQAPPNVGAPGQVALTVVGSTLPPGSTLPSDETCAALVRPANEIRTENTTANQTNVFAQGYRLTGSYLASFGYETRVTGNYSGTTDQIIQWAACKWGIDVDVVRAQAAMESHWSQSTLGDCNRVSTQPGTNGCASVGLLQVQGANLPTDHPGTWPYAQDSTAFNVDYAYAVWRACFEGKETWLADEGTGYQAGDLWGCVGRWFSGDWYLGSKDYISSVQKLLLAEPWSKPGF